MLNEALALAMIGTAGEATQQTTYSSFTLNGGAAALRLVVEIPGDNYAEENFEHLGVLYKALSTGKFSYLGDDPLAYEQAFKQITRKNQQDLQPLITLLQWVNTASDEEFAAKLGDYVDVESLANYIALQTLLNNFDDMAGPGQNYYLWYDMETEQFSVLAWDMNLAFGVRNFPGNVGQAPNTQAPAGGQAPGAGRAPGGGQAPAGGQVAGGGQAPGGNQVGGGMRGGNKLKERFLASAAFKETYNQAYAAMYQAIYGSGAALAELDRLAAVLGTSDLVPATTIQSEVASLTTAITTQAAKKTP
jgi:spore coat protein CotH